MSFSRASLTNFARIPSSPSPPRCLLSTAVTMTKISRAIASDHDELREAHQRILEATSLDEKTRWRNQFTWELARHSIGEELVVYPAFEKYLSDGKAMADHDRSEHLVVKQELVKLQDEDPANPAFGVALESLWNNLEKHMREEEEGDMKELEEKLHDGDSDSLVRSFNRTKKFIPTHSHPGAPDKPPFETVAGLLAAPLDHIKDLFRKFPEESKTGELPP